MKHDYLNHPQADGDVTDVYTGKKDYFGQDWSKSPKTRFWRGQHLSRRAFFRNASAAVGGYFLLPTALSERANAAVSTLSTAKNCIFILLAGAASHVDTFDLKVGSWTPAYFNPTSYNGVLFPQGLMPKIAEQMDSIALVRSVRAWATAHEVAQVWSQMARNPANALAKLAPHMGSVVAMELGDKTQILPPFFSMNIGAGLGQGYLAPFNAPTFISPGGGGLPGSTHPDGEAVFNRRYALALDLDSDLRSSARLGEATNEMVTFNEAARKLMYNPQVSSIFTFDQAQRNLYGNTGFGNACIAARNLLRARMGTRFVQITIGGWDNHVNIYANNANLQAATRALDNGLGPLLADLKQDGLLNETLVVVMGEFGRTVGPLNVQGGRDHHPQQTVLMAGAGIRGRRAIGVTNADGSTVIEPGWSYNREIRAEDIGATIYSALGIDWTQIKRDYPLGRGFEYIPGASTGDYAPIRELWG
ncbi:hypothetical protein F183_A45290 [Bryobacterales bacterium F-183]|nr:hypothetical protein F183_A45290 [Bryobacterales bacterium F-183]